MQRSTPTVDSKKGVLPSDFQYAEAVEKELLLLVLLLVDVPSEAVAAAVVAAMAVNKSNPVSLSFYLFKTSCH